MVATSLSRTTRATPSCIQHNPHLQDPAPRGIGLADPEIVVCGGLYLCLKLMAAGVQGFADTDGREFLLRDLLDPEIAVDLAPAFKKVEDLLKPGDEQLFGICGAQLDPPLHTSMDRGAVYQERREAQRGVHEELAEIPPAYKQGKIRCVIDLLEGRIRTFRLHVICRHRLLRDRLRLRRRPLRGTTEARHRPATGNVLCRSLDMFPRITVYSGVMSVQISYRTGPGWAVRDRLPQIRLKRACSATPDPESPRLSKGRGGSGGTRMQGTLRYAGIRAVLSLLLIMFNPGIVAPPAAANQEPGGEPGAEAQSLPRLKTGWHTPDEILLAPSPTAIGTFEHLAARFSSERILGAAEKKAAQWLQIDEVELNGSGVRLRKEYGDRFEVATFTGIGAWAETGVLAEYRLYRDWYLRSETRERGESYLEIRRVYILR